jgi:hypothetical protein
MILSPLKFFELHSREIFFVVDSKEVHVLVSVGSTLLFGSLCNPLDFLFLLSLAFFDFLSSLLCNKSWVLVFDNEILRS